MTAAADSKMKLMDFLKAFAESITDESGCGGSKGNPCLHKAADFLYRIVGIRVDTRMMSSSKTMIKSMQKDYGTVEVFGGLKGRSLTSHPGAFGFYPKTGHMAPGYKKLEADRQAFLKVKSWSSDVLKTIENRLIGVLKEQLRAFSKQELTDTKPTDNLKTYLEANELYTFTVGLKPAYSEYYNQLGAFDDSFVIYVRMIVARPMRLRYLM
eukprot:789819_1